MNHTFFVSEKHLASIRATRQGRISLGGFNYQAAFAISRMAAMVVRRRSLNLDGIPTALRYDWGEDLDELCQDSIVYFNQCKKVSDLGRSAPMADVLLGFAPKLLWASIDDRSKVRFRLVCTDQRFSPGGRLNDSISDSRGEVKKCFLERLSNSPNGRSDCAIWRKDADDFGHEELFNTLWDQTEAVFLSDAVHSDHPAGQIMEAEREALRVLLETPAIGIDVEHQRDTIARLRRVLHENLIEFDPTSNESVNPVGVRTPPRQLRREDVASELFEYRRHERQRLPFQVVSQAFLQEQGEKAKREFVARPPEWSDVVHGRDDTIKFVERDQTEDLRQAVMNELVEFIQRGTDQRLPVKFVIGPPGSGKSTIVRRVVAKLVQEGHVVAADAGVYVDNPSDPGRFCDKLNELARQGKPMLLVLDDPLSADSNWPDVLRKLANPGGRIAVLAASPTFLYDLFNGQLRGRVSKSEFHIAPPSDDEQRELDRFYGYPSSKPAQAGDDFLALAMQRAAGDSFDGIINRLWETLNNGQPILRQTKFEEYPWTVRAFLVTCFFHRTYDPCPEPILRAVLECSGGIASGRSVTDALQELKYQGGWAIFRIKTPQVPSSFSYVGNQVSAAHHRIAERAWQLRPAPWRNLSHLIVQATLEVPEGLCAVANAATALSQVGDESLANKLVDAWKANNVKTRFVYDVYVKLQLGGCLRPAAKLVDSLTARAVESPDGWMAALALRNGSASVDRNRNFPPTVNLISLIEAADFSIAPGRAIRFANCLQSSEVAAFRKRLFECLGGKFNWTLNSNLLTWLLANSPTAETQKHYLEIVKWLYDHPDVTDVRTQYLSYLMKLPDKEFESERRRVAENTAQWLDDHPDDTNVRTQYLTYLMKLPGKEFEGERRQAAKDTAQWLDDHPDDTNVRTQYLAYLMKLPDKEFEGERRRVAENAAQWLESNAGTNNILIAFVAFASKVFAVDSPKWSQIENHCCKLINENPKSFDVRHIYGSYLLKSERFPEASRQFTESLKIHPGHVASRLGLGKAFQKLKEFEKAESEFRSALSWTITTKGRRAPINTALGWLYIDWQRWEDAILVFEEARSEEPEYFGNHWGIGRAHFELENYPKAIDSLHQALDDPNLQPPASDEIQTLLVECRVKLKE